MEKSVHPWHFNCFQIKNAKKCSLSILDIVKRCILILYKEDLNAQFVS